MIGAANAVEFPPSDGSTPSGPIQSPTGVGMLTTPSGFQEVGSSYTGGQGQQYSPTASGYTSSPFSTPAPGTAILRVDLQLVAFGEGAWWTGMNGSGITSSATLNGTSINALGNKQAPYAIVGYMRLDAGIDGMSKSGIRYGGFTEIRENTLNPNSTDTSGSTSGTASTTSAGFAQASATSSGTSSFNGQQTLYVRYMWLYFGTDTAGIVRLGQEAGADALLQTGLNDEFDTGGWDGWNGSGFQPGGSGPTWPWADGGNNYTAARIAYLSPVFAGFDGVISFAPNNLPATNGGDTCTGVFTGCVTQSTSNAAADLARFRNELEVGIRYRNAWGPIGIAASGVYTVSAPTNPGPDAPSAVTSPGTSPLRYNGLNMGMIGAEVTINKYLAIGANTMFGAYNGTWGLQNKAGPGAAAYCISATACQTQQTEAIAWVAGARYTIPQLPSTIGASYFNYKFQGQPGLPTQRVSQGIDVGATYGLGPGAVVIAEYLWGQQYQGDYNFLASTSGSPLNNKVQQQIVILGMALRF
jgi:hypothetical protein